MPEKLKRSRQNGFEAEEFVDGITEMKRPRLDTYQDMNRSRPFERQRRLEREGQRDDQLQHSCPWTPSAASNRGDGSLMENFNRTSPEQYGLEPTEGPTVPWNPIRSRPRRDVERLSSGHVSKSKTPQGLRRIDFDKYVANEDRPARERRQQRQQRLVDEPAQAPKYIQILPFVKDELNCITSHTGEHVAEDIERRTLVEGLSPSSAPDAAEPSAVTCTQKAISDQAYTTEHGSKSVKGSALKKRKDRRPETCIRRKPEKRVLLDGEIQWREHADAKWEHCIPHDVIRPILFQEEATLGRERFPDPQGKGGEWDVSMYHQTYANCGLDRIYRHDLLHQFKEDGRSRPNYDPGWMRRFIGGKRCVVTDPDDKPILDYREIPLCLSSDCPGWKMELIMRSNLYIEQDDIRARFPRYTFKTKKGHTERAWHPLPGKNECINMPMLRYRDKSGSICWRARADSEGLKQATEAYMKPVDNSTRHWNRDLYKCEQDFIKWACGNTGGSGNNARTKLPEEQRALNRAKLEERMLKHMRRIGKIGPNESLRSAAFRLGFTKVCREGDDGEKGQGTDADKDFKDEKQVVAPRVLPTSNGAPLTAQKDQDSNDVQQVNETYALDDVWDVLPLAEKD